jgi:hypothetical protein
LGGPAVVLPGECVRIERVVLNELQVPKVAIIQKHEADSTRLAETASASPPGGWVSFWSVSDASPLFTVEDVDPSPRRVWGVGDSGMEVGPPQCRPKPPPTLDGSGGPTIVDENGRVVFGYRPPTTTTTEAMSLQAAGKSRCREEMRAKSAVEASALALQRSFSDLRDHSVGLNDASLTRGGRGSGDENAASERRFQWKEQSFLNNMDRSASLVDVAERPSTVSLVRGHVGMDNLSYIRQTFASVWQTVDGADDSLRMEGEADKSGLMRERSAQGYDSANSTVHSPEYWLHIEDNSEARRAGDWASVTSVGIDTAEMTQAHQAGDGNAGLPSPALHRSVTPARPPALRVPPPPPPPPERLGPAWNLAAPFESDVESFIRPIEEYLPQLRRACQIARVDCDKLAELEGLRRHWCLDEGDGNVREAGDHPFLRWLQRLGVKGIDDTLAVCGSLRKVYQDRWEAQAQEDRVLAEEAEDRRRNGLR